MANFNKMMAGKSPQEQFKTLLNAAKSRGLDVDAKIFTKEDLIDAYREEILMRL